jgi:hypothetical protein
VPLIRRWLLLFLLAAGLFPTTLCAQKEFEKDNQGDWSVALPVNPKLTGDLTVAERAEATAWVNTVLELFHKMPLLADPRGFRVIVYVRAHPDNLDDNTIEGRATHISGFLQLNLASYEKTDNGVVPVESDSAASIQIAVNDLVPLFGASSMQTGSAQTADFRLGIPEPDGTIHGFPVYDRWVVIQKNDTPLFAPVKRGDYLKYRLKKAEASLAEMQGLVANAPQQVAGMPADTGTIEREQMQAELDANVETVQQLKQQSAEMSPDEAKLATTLSDTGETGAVQFSSPDDTSAMPVVTFNPALFDSSASRSAPRILAIKFDTDDANWPDILATIDQQLDWQGLQTLLQ